MYSQEQLDTIIHHLAHEARCLFDSSLTDVILFGSYARQDAKEDSDIDVMLLVDLPREQLISYHRSVAQIAADLLYDYGIVVSPLLESKPFFESNRSHYPFFRNIDQEGIRYVV